MTFSNILSIIYPSSHSLPLYSPSLLFPIKVLIPFFVFPTSNHLCPNFLLPLPMSPFYFYDFLCLSSCYTPI